MLRSIAIMIALACATAGADAADEPCERHWTFPVPFYQSLSWSPDGSRIAFSAVTTDWKDGYRIFIADVSGGRGRLLDTGGQSELYPAWSPDGKRIAFASKRDGNTDIYFMNADGTGIIRLTRDTAEDSYPSWSPDGKRIAFHSNRDGNHDIYVMNAAGSGVVRLTDNPADDYSPAWSPDGSRIAFESDRDDVKGDEIYVVSPEGKDVTQVVPSGVFPTWAPDGKSLLYADKDLFTVNVDGSGKRRLRANVVYAAWSPDGKIISVAQISFDAVCKDYHALVLLNLNGSVAKVLDASASEGPGPIPTKTLAHPDSSH